VDGGVKVLEVTLRTPVALQCMEAMARAVPEAIVGAGTLRTTGERAQAAKDAGCQFGVSPGYTETSCRRLLPRIDLPLLPGVATASEVMRPTTTATAS
jgi:2-dehydro-3-deoxyphosphogluconate aldolase/(4S)-4-hydroxy-2-oxoglutarate aldolase